MSVATFIYKHIFSTEIKTNFLSTHSALDKNEYNHITATYFLLAERRLKITRQEEKTQANQSNAVATGSAVAVTPNNGKFSLKKPSPSSSSSSDMVDGSLEILSSNLLAPPPTGFYKSSRTGTDGKATTVCIMESIICFFEIKFLKIFFQFCHTDWSLTKV